MARSREAAGVASMTGVSKLLDVGAWCHAGTALPRAKFCVCRPEHRGVWAVMAIHRQGKLFHAQRKGSSRAGLGFQVTLARAARLPC